MTQKGEKVGAKISIAVLLVLSAAAFAYVAVSQGDGTSGTKPHHLTEEEIRCLFPCVYYPGQASAPGFVGILAEHSDTVILGRIEKFEFGGFDRPDIEWYAILRVSRVLKGQGENAYRLSIQSPERNFGPSAEGRLFFLFLRRQDGRNIWALEPWLPENEDIAAGL